MNSLSTESYFLSREGSYNFVLCRALIHGPGFNLAGWFTVHSGDTQIMTPGWLCHRLKASERICSLFLYAQASPALVEGPITSWSRTRLRRAGKFRIPQFMAEKRGAQDCLRELVNADLLISSSAIATTQIF